jgi:hypothetical protein
MPCVLDDRLVCCFALQFNHHCFGAPCSLLSLHTRATGEESEDEQQDAVRELSVEEARRLAKLWMPNLMGYKDEVG